MNLADTKAAEQAAVSWVAGEGIRGALERYGIELEDVGEWSAVGMRRSFTPAVTGDRETYEARFVGAISAAIILGIELERNGEVPR